MYYGQEYKAAFLNWWVARPVWVGCAVCSQRNDNNKTYLILFWKTCVNADDFCKGFALLSDSFSITLCFYSIVFLCKHTRWMCLTIVHTSFEVSRVWTWHSSLKKVKLLKKKHISRPCRGFFLFHWPASRVVIILMLFS